MVMSFPSACVLGPLPLQDTRPRTEQPRHKLMSDVIPQPAALCNMRKLLRDRPAALSGGKEDDWTSDTLKAGSSILQAPADDEGAVTGP